VNTAIRHGHGHAYSRLETESEMMKRARAEAWVDPRRCPVCARCEGSIHLCNQGIVSFLAQFPPRQRIIWIDE
jgi:hypothetical protein